MASLKVCKKCDSNDIEVDRARGITYCTNCGNVLEESVIVSEVQIEEAAGGGCNLIGQFVSSTDPRSIISINGLQNTLRESKEITLQNGKRLINEMASQLRLNQHCIETAFNFYKLAVQRGLTRGRKIRQVIAACLYLVCRTEGTPHMLLDLCDIVHDDACYISSLGKLAMKFAYILCIKLPEIDPGLFIPRFAQKLDFGEKTHEVTLTALRLVQRMNRDWMATGRRPSGLCGAALLVSARMYDFERNLDDIVKVVKIGKTTLRKRMLEFEDTPSSNLTVDEFHTIDLEEEHDPPAFIRSKKYSKIKQIEEMSNIEEIEKEIIQLQENIEAALSELQKPRGILAKYSKIAEIENEILGPNKDLTNIDFEIKEAEEFLSEEQINIIRSIVKDSNDSNLTNLLLTNKPATSSSSSTSIENLNLDKPLSSNCLNDVEPIDKWNYLKPTLKSFYSDLSSSVNDYINQNVNDEDNELEDDDEDSLEDENFDRKRSNDSHLNLESKRTKLDELNDQISSDLNKNQETLQSCTSNFSTINKEKDNQTNEIRLEQSDDLDLTGIDDSEIDSMLLSKDEIKTKAKLWLRANKDWLKEQKIKDDVKRKEKEETNKLYGLNFDSSQIIVNKPKRTRIRKPKNNTPVSNPQEAIERMLQEKKLSSKINYDVLKNLNKDLKNT